MSTSCNSIQQTSFVASTVERDDRPFFGRRFGALRTLFLFLMHQPDLLVYITAVVADTNIALSFARMKQSQVKLVENVSQNLATHQTPVAFLVFCQVQIIDVSKALK